MPGKTPVGARAMCVWLGTLASYRPGLIGRLVREYRDMGVLVQCPPAEVAGFAARQSVRRGRKASMDGDEGGTAAERASDATRFTAALREGPEACLRRAERRAPGELVVAWSESLYPDQLRDLGDPPLCLFVRGGSDTATTRARLSAIVDAPLVTVVGSRSPSPYGEDMARNIGGGLARAGLVVVSGLALGIDAVALAAAIDAGCGRVSSVNTVLHPGPAAVAVLGCGADVVYPRHNARLYARIAGSGLVVSEFAWGVPPRAWRFPARNRVMAALGRAVVLVEGAHRSGARITVSHAADLGRDVLCVPGEAGRKLSEAPNRLLDDGARVCESAGDVLRVIGLGDPGPGSDFAGADGGALPALVLDHGGGAVRDVLNALRDASLTIDELATRCGLPVAKVAAAVSDLEVEGLARRAEGGRYRLLGS